MGGGTRSSFGWYHYRSAKKAAAATATITAMIIPILEPPGVGSSRNAEVGSGAAFGGAAASLADEVVDAVAGGSAGAS